MTPLFPRALLRYDPLSMHPITTSVSRETMRELDRRTIEEWDIPGRLLMECAGRAVVQEVMHILRAAKVGRAVAQRMQRSSDDDGARQETPAAMKEIEAWKEELKRVSGPVCVVCGPGNNGGDGLVVSRALLNHGLAVHTLYLGSSSDIDMESDAGVNYALLKRYGHEVRQIASDADVAELRQTLSNCDVMVDAIFGTGLARDVSGLFRQAIEEINAAKTVRVSADIPSGIDANTGLVLGVAVKADITVTFAVAKHGLLRGDGPAHRGRLSVADIGIPRPLIEDVLRREASL